MAVCSPYKNNISHRFYHLVQVASWGWTATRQFQNMAQEDSVEGAEFKYLENFKLSLDENSHFNDIPDGLDGVKVRRGWPTTV